MALVDNRPVPRTVSRYAKRAVRWVASAAAGNAVVAALSWGVALIVGAVATSGLAFDWPYAIPFFLGVCLIVYAVVALLARSLLPERWFTRSVAPVHGQDADAVLRQLGETEIYIIRTRREIEAKGRLAGPEFLQGPFTPPPEGDRSRVRYGPYSGTTARRGFERLQELGVIERESYDTETKRITYRWTKLGKDVADKL